MADVADLADDGPRAVAECVAGTLAELCEELRGGLRRLEAAQALWGDPLDGGSALRRGIREELRRAGAEPPSGGPPPRQRAASCSEERHPESLESDSPTRSAATCPVEPRNDDLPKRRSTWSHRNMYHKSMSVLTLGTESSLVLDNVRRLACKVVRQHALTFDAIMGLVIISNSVIVGLEIQLDIEGKDVSVIKSTEHFFLVVFLLETVFRVLAKGAKNAWKSAWFRFDIVLVFIGVCSSWIVEPILSNVMRSSSADGVLDVVSQVLVLRILRLLRLVRALRVFEQFQQMWKLANGLIHSIRTVLSACAMLLGTVYIFACFGIEMITRNERLREDAVINELIQAKFSSLHRTMLTLLQFATADSIASVYEPLVERAWPLAFYFGSLWLVVTICLMNLVTAVIVDEAIAQGEEDREMHTTKLRKKIKENEAHIKAIFKDLDHDGDGQLALKELEHGLAQVDHRRLRDLPEDLQSILTSDQLIDLYEYLDADNSGEVDEQEFLEGISHLLCHSVPIETTQALQLLRSQNKMLGLIRDSVCFEGSGLRLASDHQLGVSSLSVLAAQRFKISRGDRAEHVSAKATYFNVHLNQPLAQAHTANSRVIREAAHGPPSQQSGLRV